MEPTLKKLVKSQAGLWVFAPDAHSPQIDKPTFNSLLHFVSDNKLRGFIWGGDQNDNEEISHHNRKNYLKRSPGSYRRNTDFFDSKVLAPIESLLGKGVARVWIEGNHDDWENQLVQENPELFGTVERRGLLGLDKRGWDFIAAGEIYKLGKLAVIHGETLTGLGNQAPGRHAFKALLAYSSSVLYGHVHAPQSDSRIAPFSQKDKHMAWCSPILGATNPTYLRNRPTAWVNGFTIVEVREDGMFNVLPIVVTRGKFSYGGIIYGG
jgi:hypothetical protein